MANLKDLIVNGSARILGTIYGNLVGNSATATKATQDGDGRNIVNTYADKSEIDGQWVASYRQIANSVEWKTNTSPAIYSLSDYLPNDNSVYEVLIGAIAYPDQNTLKKYVNVNLQTDIITNHDVHMCTGRTCVTGISNESSGACILIVGTGRYIRQYTSSSANAGGTYSIELFAYRKVR